MKGKKRIGMLALSLAFVGFATSCGSYAISRNTEPTKEEDAIVIEDSDTTVLRSILLDTSNVRKTFYIGEEFNYDGLVVNRTLAVYDKNNSNKGNVNIPTKDFTVDSSEVDMTKTGTYKVTVSHRLSNRIITSSYNIDVKSSVFESTAGLTYNAGLEVYFEDGKRIKNFLLHDTYVEKLKDGYDHDFNLYNLFNGLSIKLHKWTSDGKEATETRVISLSPTDVTIDSSSVNIDKIGTYVVKVTYEADDIVIDGVSYENNAEAFLIIDVSDPVQSIWVEGAQKEFGQTLGAIDFSSADWIVHVETAVEGEYSEPLTYDKYSVSAPDILNTESDQKVTISLNENPAIQTKKNVRIVASTTQDIHPYYELTPKIAGYDDDGKASVIKLAGSDFIFGPRPKEFEKVDIENASGIVYDSGAKYTGGRSDTYGIIRFPIRISIQGSEQVFKVVMDKSGDIVVFFANSKDAEAELGMYTSNSSGVFKQVVSYSTNTTTKQEIVSAVYHVEEAGTYYFYAPTNGLYVHGFLIAKDK